jgi:energy-coupling factor transporter ATP-binding protein EcfA2
MAALNQIQTAPVPRGERAVIAVEDVHKCYDLGGTQVHALRGVSVEVRRSEFVAIMGASGSGKSTFMNMLGCLGRPSSGRYLLEGIDVSQHDKKALALDSEQRWKIPNCLRCTPRSTRRSAVSGRWKRWQWLVWPTGRSTFRRKCLVGNSNGSLSLGRWSTVRRSCWPTSPRATSTAERRSRSWRSSKT